jgi:myo-inositol-1(or 4)-monophosphatase
MALTKSPSFALNIENISFIHDFLVDIAQKSGRIALENHRVGKETTARIHWKGGVSPVTDADLAVDAMIAREVRAFPDIAYHSEERPDRWEPSANGLAFVVDPIDGTRDFIAGGDAWCITIGLVVDHIPVAGAIHLPARGQTYSAWQGGGAWLDGAPLVAPRLPGTPLTATGPKSAIEALSRRLGRDIRAASPIPALAHRALAPLNGHADLALSRAGGHDWDIAAADCILAEAGGALRIHAGTRPVYRLRGEAQAPLIAIGPALREKILPLLLTNPA